MKKSLLKLFLLATLLCSTTVGSWAEDFYYYVELGPNSQWASANANLKVNAWDGNDLFAGNYALTKLTGTLYYVVLNRKATHLQALRWNSDNDAQWNYGKKTSIPADHDMVKFNGSLWDNEGMTTSLFNPSVSVAGSFNNWTSVSMVKAVNSDVVSVSIPLNPSTSNYEFKVWNDGTAYGNDGTIDRNTTFNTWWLMASNKGNCKLKPINFKGVYTFTYGIRDNRLCVSYPRPVATASSVYGDANVAANAIDEKGDTRWESEHSDNQWWQVDYLTPQSFDAIKITWENAYGKSFKIQGSNDAESYVDLIEVSNQNLGDVRTQALYLQNEVSYRYVRFVGNARATQWGYSFYEFEIYKKEPDVISDVKLSTSSVTCKLGESVSLTTTLYSQYKLPMSGEYNYSVEPAQAGHIVGDTYFADELGISVVKVTSNDITKTLSICGVPSDNFALNKPSECGFQQSDGTGAAKGNNGNHSDHWTSWGGDAENAWWKVDLQSIYSVQYIVINPWIDSAPNYVVYGSLDGTNWFEVITGKAVVNGTTFDEINDVLVRYLKINLSQANAGFKEFEVYGVAANEQIIASDIVANKVGTVCYPNKMFPKSGATFYKAVSRDNAVVEQVTKIDFEKVDVLEAGMPYIYIAEGGDVVVYEASEVAAEAGSLNGMVGTFTRIEDANETSVNNVLEGNYAIASNQIIKCGYGCKLAANRAYIVMKNVPYAAPTQAAGRISLGMQGANTATGLDDVENNDIKKMMIDGVLFIFHNGKTYDAFGRQVK